MADGVETIIAGVLAVAPRGAEASALCTKGAALIVAGEVDAALACFDRALRLDVTFADAWVGRARILSVRQRANEAFGCINRALDVDPRNVAALIEKGHIQRGRGLPEEALAAYDGALAAGAGEEAREARAAVLAALGRVEAPPRRAPVLEKKATPRPAARVDPRAEKKSMREAVPEAPRPDPLVARKTAPAALLAGAGVRPTSKRPSGRLARHSSAPRGLTQVELDLAAFDEVRALGLAGRHMEGLRKLEPIAKRCPSSREAWTLRGQILFALAQYEPALASVERVIKIDAKDQDALRLMIKILTATKKDVRALEMASLLVSLAPRDAEAHRLHADCLVGAMHHGEAVAVYEKVILLVPDDPLPWLGLGRTLRQLRRPAEARMALSKARALAEASGQADVVAQAVELLAKLPAA